MLDSSDSLEWQVVYSKSVQSGVSLSRPGNGFGSGSASNAKLSNARSLRLVVLAAREPEFPHDAPTRSEVALWYLWCIGGVFGPAALVAVTVALFIRWAKLGQSSYWGHVVFLTVPFLLGMVGTTIFSEWADTFVLTWPACLYVSFRTILALGVWAGNQPRTLRIRVRSGTALMVFLGICFGYYKLCAMIGYAVGWCFLIGFLPATPVAVLAAKQRRWWLRWILDTGGFTVYFWFSGLLPEWKGRGGV